MAKLTPSEYSKRWRNRKRNSGLCVRCGKNEPFQETGKICWTCTIKTMAQKHLGAKERFEELEKLLNEQGHKCAYSGRPLEIGINASIEHVAPKSKHPLKAKDLDNLKWVDLSINKMKHELSLPEFLQTCKEILMFFGYQVRSSE